MVIGVDGCKSGWIAAVLHNSSIKLELFPNIEALWQRYASSCAQLLIDMPIGLSENGPEGRTCDRLARRMLSPRRHSSIFTPPCRNALYVPADQASAVNFKHTGKKLSRQTINIMPKMREVDTWMRQLPEKEQRRIRESHPEVIFTAMNNGVPLFHNKKTKAGQLERISLLEKFYPKISEVLKQNLIEIPRKTALPDDRIDALVLSIAAAIAFNTPEKCRTLPNPSPKDSEGLAMEIFYVDL